MKCDKERYVVFGILFIFGIVLIVTPVTLDTLYAQTNSTINQTSVPTTTNSTGTSAQNEASQSIREGITETGEFLGNVTQKIITSKSSGTILNETSDVLGNASVETKKSFSPN